MSGGLCQAEATPHYTTPHSDTNLAMAYKVHTQHSLAYTLGGCVALPFFLLAWHR